MEKLANSTAVFIATVIGTLEEMGVLDRVMLAFWRVYVKVTQPQITVAAKSNKDDNDFISQAKTDGWVADEPLPGKH